MFKAKQIIFIAGSAGSIQTLTTVLASVPKDFECPIVIVVHRKSNIYSQLHKVLGQYCCLPVQEVEHGEKMKIGTIYLAPSNYHLMVSENGILELDYSEKEMFSRPSIDVSVEFFARAFRDKLTFIILSGANSDGAVGSKKVKKFGGHIIVQDPSDCVSATMPQAVIEANMNVDFIVEGKEIIKSINEILS